MKTTYILLFLIISPFITPIKGQITIGSNEKPRAGALLDLKEDNISGANSSKGLMLPRVILTKRDMLYPMLPSNYDKSTEDANHMGLIVYNTSDSYFLEQSGPYVWDGKEWVYLIDESKEAQDLNTYTDQEGNKFLAAKFGNAGIWMVQNLRAKTYDPIRDLKNETLYTNIQIRYPSINNTLINDEQLAKAHPWMGVFYDFYTATNNYNWQKISSGTESANDRVQGICPNGWHVPSTHEWHRLEAELINNTKKHTTLDKNYVDEGVVHEALVTGANNQTQYGIAYRPALIDPAPMPGYNNTINGVSLKPSLGGFAVRMIGVINGDSVEEYGNKAGFWVAYSLDANNGRNRVFLNDALYNNNGGKSRFYSIRCVKNDNNL